MGTISVTGDGPGAGTVAGAGGTGDDAGGSLPGGGQPPGKRVRSRARRWSSEIAVGLTTAALVLTLAVEDARADAAQRLDVLTVQLDERAAATNRLAERLAALLADAEAAYSTSPDADPAALEVLGEALEDARDAARFRVADVPPATVRQAEGRLEQARTIDESLRWAAQDLADALGELAGRPVPVLASAR